MLIFYFPAEGIDMQVAIVGSEVVEIISGWLSKPHPPNRLLSTIIMVN